MVAAEIEEISYFIEYWMSNWKQLPYVKLHRDAKEHKNIFKK